jgi:hypothetical protein
MRKTLLILTLGVMAITAKAGWSYSGLDGHGHWVTGHWDNNGNYSGLDGNGHWITGHMNNGHYSGLDGNGNWVTGQWTPN